MWDLVDTERVKVSAMPPKNQTARARANAEDRRNRAQESARVFFEHELENVMDSAQDRQYEQGGLPPMGASGLPGRQANAPSTNPNCNSPAFPYCFAVRKRVLVQVGLVLGALTWRRSRQAAVLAAPFVRTADPVRNAEHTNTH